MELAPHLVLDLEEARVAGSGGVNRLSGHFVLSEDELRFGRLATTRMAGPENAMRRRTPSSPHSNASRPTSLDCRTLTLLADEDAVVRLSC